MAYTERIIETIQKLTGKKHVMLTTRCNAAILLGLKVAKHLGYNSVTIPDVGGWMTYEQFAVKLKMPLHKIKTDDGIIDVDTLKLKPKTVLLIHSLAGYHWRLDTKKLAAICKRDGALFIEDVCGTIGEPTHGDIVVCSFGSAKPVDFGHGGFFAMEDVLWFEIAKMYAEPIEIEEQHLLDKLTPVNLNKRKKKLFDVREKLRSVFEKEEFVPEGDSKALVLIVPYEDAEEKARIIDLCVNNKVQTVEYTECPRYIRSGKQAISVEIKRL